MTCRLLLPLLLLPSINSPITPFDEAHTVPIKSFPSQFFPLSSQSFSRPHYFPDRLLEDLPGGESSSSNSFLQIYIYIRQHTNCSGWHSKPILVLPFPAICIAFVLMGSSNNQSPHFSTNIHLFCINSDYSVFLACLSFLKPYFKSLLQVFSEFFNYNRTCPSSFFQYSLCSLSIDV